MTPGNSFLLKNFTKFLTVMAAVTLFSATASGHLVATSIHISKERNGKKRRLGGEKRRVKG